MLSWYTNDLGYWQNNEHHIHRFPDPVVRS